MKLNIRSTTYPGEQDGKAMVHVLDGDLEQFLHLFAVELETQILQAGQEILVELENEVILWQAMGERVQELGGLEFRLMATIELDNAKASLF